MPITTVYTTKRTDPDLGAGGTAAADFGVVATLDSIGGWRAYDERPSHEAIRSVRIRPWIAERVSIQFSF